MEATDRKSALGLWHVRMELAREKEHPMGDRNFGYDLVVPLTPDGTLDPEEWKKRKDDCRVRRFRPGEEDQIGKLRRKPGGQWFFDYGEGEDDDEIGFRLGEERFVVGEYVSVRDDEEKMRTYQIKIVEPV